MTIKPTPGPWVYTPAGRTMADSYSQPFAIAQDEKPNLIAGCFGDVRGGVETAEANARLIAAAPDMLALLRELIDIEGPQPGTSDWANKVRAAISKAEA